jgi:hypothetical protein
MTNRPTKIVHNIETGVVEEIELTDEEIAHAEEQAQHAQEQQAIYDAEEASRQALKASALAKLAALGLTEEEAAAITRA